MKTPVRALVAALLLLLGAAASAPVLAHGSVHFGVGIGVPLYSPWYYPPPYYYPYPSPVVVQNQPPVYVERAPAQAVAAPADSYWYYCTDSKTYYPYVKSCSSAWQRVRPQPPGT